MRNLQDSFARTFKYLRLSVTDKCNFRCAYCLPNGYKKNPNELEQELSVTEIRRLVGGFAELGFKKVRLTGGEPTLRKDIVEIVEAVASQKNIEKVAMTTNAFRLQSLLPDLKRAGLSALNISLDSLEHENFSTITGSHRFEEVFASIEQALVMGFSSVKVNVVLLKGQNDLELDGFLEFVKARSVSVRFIELMKTGDNQDFFAKHHVSMDVVKRSLYSRGWEEIERRTEDGPAAVFVHPGHIGQMGLIAPYAKDFCETCNRLRVSARGRLRLCLFGNGDLSLRSWLQSDESAKELPNIIESLVLNKKSSHQLLEGIYGSTANLAEIGG
jgi:cyclic pyranopterin phosphate synthase